MSEKIQYLVSNVKETTVGGRKILAGGKETIALKEALMNHSGARAAITKESRDRVIGLANEGKWTGLSSLLNQKTAEMITESAAPIAPVVAQTNAAEVTVTAAKASTDTTPIAPAGAKADTATTVATLSQEQVAVAKTPQKEVLSVDKGIVTSFTASDRLPKITSVSQANQILTVLKAAQAKESGDEGDMEVLTTISGKILAVETRLTFLQNGVKVAEEKTFTSSEKNPKIALKDAKEFDTFILANFGTVEIDKQIYYIANKDKSMNVVKLLKDDDSSVRTAFIQKMGSTQVSVGDKDYPAIATRDGLLGAYKINNKEKNLSSTVAFDEKQNEKVITGLKNIETSPANAAEILTKRFITTVQGNPEQTKTELRKAIQGNDPRENKDLENLLKTDFSNQLIDWNNSIITSKLTAAISKILNNKSPAFVINDTSIAFDGVSMVPGAMVRGKMEGKNSSEGFYEVKTSTVDAFVAGIPDADSSMKKILIAADGKGPIELGGKVFEVKNGQILSLGKPEGPAFRLSDVLPANYSTSDGVRDAIIVALAVKVWGVPNISLALPNISLALPNISLALPELSTHALHLLGGFGLGWFAASLYYGENTKIGKDTKNYSKYQSAYNTLTTKKERQGSVQIGETEYKHMSWDKEGDVKIYRPTGIPENKHGYDIVLLALNADDSINPDNTFVTSNNKNIKLSTLENSMAIMKAISE